MKRNQENNLRNSQEIILSKDWYFCNTGISSGEFNMKCDLFFLESLIEEHFKNPVFRVYAWDKATLSVGANQGEVSNGVNYPVVRRATGGQAVLHKTKEDELTYSICIDLPFGAKKLYYLIGSGLIRFLKCYGLEGVYGYSEASYRREFDCFNSKSIADIVVSNLKLIGSAQYRKRNFVLQHGTVRLDLMRELANKEVKFDSAVECLKLSFQKELKIKFMDLSLKTSEYEKINHYKNNEIIDPVRSA